MEQLERLVESKHFRNSKRYPTFLRFVVEQTLAGRTESLKERTLGVGVFARPNDYDTNADPIVRVTAGEIRKRIAQYYQEPGHEHELRIDLPLGAYVPHFFEATPVSAVAEEAAPAEVVTETPLAVPTMEAASEVVVEPLQFPLSSGLTKRRRLSRTAGWLIAVALGAVVLGGLTGLWWYLRPHTFERGVNAVWQPIIDSPNPALIVIGTHSLDNEGREEDPGVHGSAAETSKDMLAAMVRSDMVPVSDVVSYSHLTDLLTQRSHVYTSMGSADATLEQIRKGPVVLIGGLDNLWTLRLSSKLRYRFQERRATENSIVDSEHPERVLRFDNLQREIVNTTDYAIVASYFDPEIEQPVLIVAGIGKAGTQVAAEFVTSDPALRAWKKQAKLPPNKNLEIVLSTEILDGKAGPPHVVASVAW